MILLKTLVDVSKQVGATPRKKEKILLQETSVMWPGPP
jgi:hypothetical protein